jgi:tetratricopeptide (TPR) repeat protein
MGRSVFNCFAASLCLSVCVVTSANAQGISEMGSVYAMPKGAPSSSYAGAVNRVYGLAADSTRAATDDTSLPAGSTNAGGYTAAAYQKYVKLANDAYNKGQIAEKAGKINDAQHFYYQALSIRQNLWGVGDRGALTILLKLGDINAKKKNLAYAEQCYKQYLGGLAKATGPGSYESAFALSKLAQLYSQKEQYDEAANMLRQILALQERKFGSDSKECRVTRMNLVDALIKDKEFLEARDILHDQIAAESSKNNQHNQDYLHLLTCYATCQRGLNREEEAKETDAKIAALQKELDLAQPSEGAKDEKTPDKASADSQSPTKVDAASVTPPTFPAGKVDESKMSAASTAEKAASSADVKK